MPDLWKGCEYLQENPASTVAGREVHPKLERRPFRSPGTAEGKEKMEKTSPGLQERKGWGTS